VSAAVQADPNIVKGIRELAADHIKLYKDRAIFLCVHSAVMAANLNPAFELITEHNIAVIK
jgi:hypothetical protein